MRAGADSIEHGIDLDDETISEMKTRGTVWVPTIDHNSYYVDAKDEYGFPAEAIPPLQDYIQRNLESARRVDSRFFWMYSRSGGMVSGAKPYSSLAST